jgi:hypothetical protein
MAKPTFTADLNTVFTAHGRSYLSSMPADNFYTGTPTLSMLRRKSRKKTGSKYIIEPLLEGGEPIGGSFLRAEALPTTPTDPVTEATYTWAHYAEPVSLFWQDEFHAGGAGALFNYLEVRINDARMRLERKLATDLWGTAGGEGAGDLTALPTVISATTTLGTLAPATYTWWVAQNNDTVTFATGGLDSMRNMANDVTAGGLKQHDWIVTSQAIWEKYVDLAENKHNIYEKATGASGRVADLGFPVASYMGRGLTWDIYAATNHNDAMWFVNNDAMYLLEADGGPFRLTEFQSMTVNGQQGRIAYLRWSGQLICRNRRCLGSITTIT